MRRFYCYMKKNRFLTAVLASVAVIVVLVLWVWILLWAEKHITPVYQDYRPVSYSICMHYQMNEGGFK